ncbi:MAG TPA: ammonium transporter [Hyphomicrobiaceae bacterium]|nr:ammonium transporter [Hyphomicrobiaceae bacterium]
MINGADTAWVLTSTALVLFMTLPGLALFYAGLVRSSNVLSVLMHCFAIACLVSVLWLVCAYSLSFAAGNPWIGDLSKVFLAGAGASTVYPNTTIPETVFFMFQMTFAIITPALIVGAFVERIKFEAVLLFSGLWLIIVYAPVAHWVWGGGWLAALGIMDFAGGLVVHLTAGVSALILAVLLRPRAGFPNDVKPPHAPWMTMVGASMLWMGWYGFNAGSALSAGGNAGMAMTVTHVSAATASLVWMVIEWVKFGRPSLIGMVTGTIAGLASITPASGFVGPFGAVVIGLAGGGLCYVMVSLVKQRFRIDDSLDVFAVHGVGGATGVLLTAIFVDTAFGGAGLPEGRGVLTQFGVQLLGGIATLAWSVVATYGVIRAVQATVGLRVSNDDELRGLDLSAHGESGYNM